MHKDTLKQLFPAPLEGVFDADIVLEGAQLDTAQASAELLLREAFPESCDSTIADWERVFGVTPNAADVLQTRQLRVIARLRERGGLTLPYFTTLAETMGYTVTIEELMPNTDGYGLEGRFRWRVTFTGIPVIYFRAGQSRAGDYLLDASIASALEGLFTDIKPAHTQVIYAYV